jgi:hypothetical protein
MPARPPKLHYAFPSLPGGADRRLGEMVLYVAAKGQDDPAFDLLQLKRVLYFSDFMAYARLGSPVTGAPYVKQAAGPAPQRLATVMGRLRKSGAAVTQEVERWDGTQVRVIPLRKAELELFTASQIDVVNEVINTVLGRTGTEASLSNGVVWRVLDLGEPIPYEAAFISDEPLTEGDIAETRRLASQLGWNRADA